MRWWGMAAWSEPTNLVSRINFVLTVILSPNIMYSAKRRDKWIRTRIVNYLQIAFGWRNMEHQPQCRVRLGVLRTTRPLMQLRFLSHLLTQLHCQDPRYGFFQLTNVHYHHHHHAPALTNFQIFNLRLFPASNFPPDFPAPLPYSLVQIYFIANDIVHHMGWLAGWLSGWMCQSNKFTRSVHNLFVDCIWLKCVWNGCNGLIRTKKAILKSHSIAVVSDEEQLHAINCKPSIDCWAQRPNECSFPLTSLNLKPIRAR